MALRVKTTYGKPKPKKDVVDLGENYTATDDFSFDSGDRLGLKPSSTFDANDDYSMDSPENATLRRLQSLQLLTSGSLSKSDASSGEQDTVPDTPSDAEEEPSKPAATVEQTLSSFHVDQPSLEALLPPSNRIIGRLKMKTPVTKRSSVQTDMEDDGKDTRAKEDAEEPTWAQSSPSVAHHLTLSALPDPPEVYGYALPEPLIFRDPHDISAASQVQMSNISKTKSASTANKSRAGARKKEEAMLDMYRENERLVRTTEMNLQGRKVPRKSMASFLSKFTKPDPDNIPFNTAIPIESPLVYDSDSDLEIVNIPQNALRQVSSKGIRTKSNTWKGQPPSHTEINDMLRQKVAIELLRRRREAEMKAKDKGTYRSTDENLQKQIAKEIEYEEINKEVERALERSSLRVSQRKGSTTEDDEEEEEEEEEEEDYTTDDEAEGSDDEDGDNENERDNKETDTLSKDDHDIGTDGAPTPKIHEPLESSERERDDAPISFSDEEGSDRSPNNSGEEDNSPSKKWSESKASAGDDDTSQSAAMSTETATRSDINRFTKRKVSLPIRKLAYVEEEAEVEEDEFMMAGGEDYEDENMNEYEVDGMIDENAKDLNEKEEEAVRDEYRRQEEEVDAQLVERLMKDVQKGGFRKRRQLDLSGKGLGLDFDYYSDEEDDLIARRLREAAKRRKMREEMGNVLQAMASKPETAAFAKACLPDLGADECLLLSDGEAEPIVELSEALGINKDGIDGELESFNECAEEVINDVNFRSFFKTVRTDRREKRVEVNTDMDDVGETITFGSFHKQSMFASDARIERYRIAIAESRNSAHEASARHSGFGAKDSKPSKHKIKAPIIRTKPTLDAINRGTNVKQPKLLGFLSKESSFPDFD